jgi:hypothetical protein
VNLQQSIVLALLILAEWNSVNILLLGRQFEIYKLHVLPTAQTKVMHEGLKKYFAMAFTIGQFTSDLGIKDFGFLDTASDVEELDQGVKVLD